MGAVRHFLILFFFVIPIVADAQLDDLEFNYFVEDDILIQSVIVSMAESNDGRLWFGSKSDGLIIYDGYDFSYFRHDPTDSLSLISNEVLGFLETSSGEMWIGTKRGISIFRPSQPGFKNLLLSQFGSNQLSDYSESIIEDHNGQMWIATSDGLIHYNPHSSDVSVYRIPTNPSIPKNVSENFFIRLVQDQQSQNILWLGSQHGLKSFDAESKQFSHHLNPPKWHKMEPTYQQYSIFDMQWGEGNVLWMAGWASGGLLRYQPSTGEWEQYLFQGGNQNDPYKGNRAWTILPLSDSVVIIGGAQGIGYANFQKHTIEYLDHWDIEKIGWARESAVDKNGILWFLCKNGIAKSKKPVIRINQVPKKPHITEFVVDEMRLSLNNPSNLTFPSGTKELYFTTSLINPTNPSEAEYRWKLEGYDSRWKNENLNRIARYSNLRGGKYSFIYEAREAGGDWIAGEQLDLTIKKPFYLRPFFVALVIGFFSLIIGGIIKITAHITRREEMIKSAYEKRLLEAELATLRTQMNPHFIFNSLNSIYNFIHENDMENAAEYLVKFSKLMRLVLQHSKERLIRLEEELEVIQLYIELEHIRFNEKFTYQIKVDKTLDLGSLYLPPMLIQPFIENAIWHGLMHRRGPGTLQVSIQKNEDSNQIEIQIVDNGVGRTQAAQNKSGRKKKSMGMSITRQRINSLESRYGKKAFIRIIDLVDPEGQPAGTEVQLNIPMIFQNDTQ